MCDSEATAIGGPGNEQDLNSSMEMDSDTAATLLHQTTQSLLMASNMMLMPNGVVGVVSDGKLPSATVPPTSSSVTSPQVVAAINNHVKVNVEELLRENYALREKLKEVTSDRDRLLCEVSNLRLELDMSELKRLPQESFPQKVIDRPGPGQYAIAAASAPGSISSGSTSTATGGYVYLQPSSHYPPPSQQQIVYQHHPHIHQLCHQQQPPAAALPSIVSTSGTPSSLLSSALSASSAASASPVGVVHHNHHHHIHGHHHHHGGAVVIAGSGVGTGVGVAGGAIGSNGSSNAVIQQSLHKKNSIRSGGEVMKRSRAQTAYELSQDLLEKQIELLERKYGGVRARNAAITIQRAFRHYMMVKKFASITAMAKAEKRLSRRMMINAAAAAAAAAAAEDGPPSNTSSSSAYGSATESQLDHPGSQQHCQQQQQHHQPRVTIMAGPPGATGNVARTPPTRSMSLRERRHLDSSPIPRSQSGNTSPMPIAHCTYWSQPSVFSGAGSTVSTASSASTASSTSSHPHVNLLHATEQHYYSSAAQMQANIGGPHYVSAQSTYHAIPHDVSYSSNSSHLDSSLNSSWVSGSGTGIPSTSPHTPYYSAAQIYMRPKALVTTSERKKVPPEVPKRTSSITAQQAAAQQQMMQQMRQTPPPPSMIRTNGLCKTAENGSLTSVQSSGSDSSATSADRIANCDLGSDRSNSPHTWKRGTALNSSNQFSTHSPDHILMMASHPPATTTGMVVVSDDHMSSHTSAAQYEQHAEAEQLNVAATTMQNYKVSETIRKRQYRVGLNLFNKKPEKGITYLIRRGFLENTPQGVARFLISRKGLSRQMIGEYLGNLQNPFNMAVLECFATELDLSGMQVDVALRKFQAYFRMPGEAQKIERLMEIFSQRYCQCNQDIVGRLRSSDTIFVLAFAIIMLNTDLHTPNLKPERRMRVEDFIKNLRGIDDCHDIDRDMLAGVYERVKANEFKPGSDHVTQVMKVQATIVGKKPNLALPHRRLVCYCRLYEIPDVNKKERPGVHQREVFLFNDLLVITKIFSKKKSSVTYTFRNSFPLCGMVVTLLDVLNYPFCIQLSQKVDAKILVTFNARNEHDRCKFADDLKESISEMDEMESLRIEAELERQKSARNRAAGNSENRDSGVADVEVCPCPFQSPQGSDSANGNHDTASQLKRSALSNSLLDMHEQFGNEKPQRRGSVGSLDSGMSISFQSTTASSASRENAAVVAAAANAAAAKMRFPPPAGASGVILQQHPQQYPGHHMMQAYHHHPAVMIPHPGVIHPHQLQPQQHQHPQQQIPLTGRIPGRERKMSRSDESGRSTEV